MMDKQFIKITDMVDMNSTRCKKDVFNRWAIEIVLDFSENKEFYETCDMGVPDIEPGLVTIKNYFMSEDKFISTKKVLENAVKEGFKIKNFKSKRGMSSFKVESNGVIFKFTGNRKVGIRGTYPPSWKDIKFNVSAEITVDNVTTFLKADINIKEPLIFSIPVKVNNFYMYFNYCEASENYIELESCTKGMAAVKAVE
jgi:predicted transposase YbfD/YdcC